MVYTRKQMSTIAARMAGRENVTGTKESIKIRCAHSNAAEFGVTGLQVMHNVHAYTHNAYIVIPISASGHTIRYTGTRN